MWTNVFSFSQQLEFCKSEEEIGMACQPNLLLYGKRHHYVYPPTFHLHMILSKRKTGSGRERNHLPQDTRSSRRKEATKRKEYLSLPSATHIHIWCQMLPDLPLDSRDSLIRTPRVHWSETHTRRKGWVSRENPSSSIWLRTFGSMRQCKYQQIKIVGESKLRK